MIQSKNNQLKTFYNHTVNPADDGEKDETIRELLGLKDIDTTMIFTHVLSEGGQ